MVNLRTSQRLNAAQRTLWSAPRHLPLHSKRMASSQPPTAAAAATASQEQTAGIIDGREIAEDIRKEIATEVQQLKDKAGRVPGLAVVLVGSRKDSETYVRSKKKACAEVGFESFGIDLLESCSQEELLQAVANFNADPKVSCLQKQLDAVLPHDDASSYSVG
eukprot:GHRR01026621.1.p1 GENE.GHRR01026621.1~~GHRR01026621.1.p1  ORF type:complete len:163 (-),score=48.55 GHRR01026621.1:624-1112(-)